MARRSADGAASYRRRPDSLLGGGSVPRPDPPERGCSEIGGRSRLLQRTGTGVSCRRGLRPRNRIHPEHEALDRRRLPGRVQEKRTGLRTIRPEFQL